MFRTQEGLSTLSMAGFLAQRGLEARFVSIDEDPEHLRACRDLIASRDPELLDRVELVRGNSLQVLPDLVAEMGAVHFAFLDGSGHPGINLAEFELIAGALADGGLCLVDDVTDTRPTEFYSARRPFGKGTLLYPLLVLTEYLDYQDALRAGGGGFGPKEQPLPADRRGTLLHSVRSDLGRGGRSYRVLHSADGRHGMLAYGRRDLLASIESLLGP